jgi:hypothetical protein
MGKSRCALGASCIYTILSRFIGILSSPVFLVRLAESILQPFQLKKS